MKVSFRRFFSLSRPTLIFVNKGHRSKLANGIAKRTVLTSDSVFSSLSIFKSPSTESFDRFHKRKYYGTDGLKKTTNNDGSLNLAISDEILDNANIDQLETLLSKTKELMDDGIMQSEIGNHENAEVTIESSLLLREKIFGQLRKRGCNISIISERNMIAQTELILAYCKQALHKYEDAEKLYEHSFDIVRDSSPNSLSTSVIILNYAELHYNLKKFNIAVDLCRDALKIIRQLQPDSELHGACLSNLSGYLCAQSKWAEAKPYSQKALKIFLEKLGKRHVHTKNSWTNYYVILKELNLEEEAKDLENDWQTLNDPVSHSENLTDEQIMILRQKIEDKYFSKDKDKDKQNTEDSTLDPRFSDICDEIKNLSLENMDVNSQLDKIKKAATGNYDPKSEVWGSVLSEMNSIDALMDEAGAEIDSSRRNSIEKNIKKSRLHENDLESINKFIKGESDIGVDSRSEHDNIRSSYKSGTGKATGDSPKNLATEQDSKKPQNIRRSKSKRRHKNSNLNLNKSNNS